MSESSIKQPFNRADIQRVFDDLKQNPLFVSGGVQGGCEFRSHLIGLKLQDMGYTVRKAWLLCSSSSNVDDIADYLRGIGVHNLQFLPSYSEDDVPNYYAFNFHVAPVVILDGREIVFDLPFFDGPVSIEQWYDSFGSKEEELEKILFYTGFNVSRIMHVMEGILAKTDKKKSSLENEARAHLEMYHKSGYVRPSPDRIAHSNL